jgi:hypothetical protein
VANDVVHPHIIPAGPRSVASKTLC